jgi:O-antigen ligase
MRAIARAWEHQRNQMTLWVLLAASAVIGVLAGSQTAVTPKGVLYALVVLNILLLGYTLILKNMVFGVLLYFYSLTFLNYYWRLILPGRWPDLDIPRMMFVFIWVVFLVEVMVGERRLSRRTNIDVAMLLVLAACVISMLTHGLVLIRPFLNGYAIAYAMFAIAKNVFWKKKDVERFVFLLAVPLSLYFPLNNIFEHYGLNRLVFPTYILDPTVTYEWGGRAMGAFIQPVATGFAMVGIYVLSMYSLSRMRSAFARIYAGIVTLITPIGVFFSYTRSVYLGYFAAMLIFTIFSRRLRLLGLILVVGMVLGVLGNWSQVTTEQRETGGMANTETLMSRLVLMEASLRMFMDHPFRGVGFGRFKDYSGPYVGQIRTTILGYRESWIGRETSQHNQFFSVLVETGMLGAVPLLLMYVFLVKTLIAARRVKMEAVEPDLLVAIWAVMAAYIVNVSFIEPKYFEFMNAFPFTLAGIVVGNYYRSLGKSTNNRGREGIA